MSTLYLDVFSGLSGDMFLGAMIDLGLDLRQLERELAKLGLRGYHLHASRRQNSQIEGVKFDVHLEGDHHHEHHDHAHEHDHDKDPAHSHSHSHEHHHHGHQTHTHSHSHRGEQEHDHDRDPDRDPDLDLDHGHEEHRDFAQIKELIQNSPLSDWVKGKAIAVFQRVALAEGKIHGRPPESVHFHEVGGIDSIVDIVGACIALDLLGRPRVLASPVVDGTGWIQCAHGRFPVPAPATLEILGARGVPLSQCDEPHELITPTGAALLAEFAESFAPIAHFRTSKVGYGVGTRVNKTRPNVVRAMLGETVAPDQDPGAPGPDWETDTIAVLEANLDDCSGELLGYIVERALSAGALDVFHTPIQMKKSRPGVLLTVLCEVSRADEFTRLLLHETSSFGVRRSTATRRKLRRELVSIPTRFGEVIVKVGRLDGKVLRVTPEFETCKQLAERSQVPLQEVYRAADEAARNLRAEG